MDLDIHGQSTLIGEFEKRARAQPKNVAIEDSRDQWTYGQLAARVHELAQCLLANGIGPASYVGIYLHSSAELIATILAVLKVGAAYVPVDRSAPAERLNFITSDANLRVVITDDAQLQGNKFLQNRELVDRHSEPSSPRFPIVAADSDAYVIYTSGSSGQPKGVICTHRNVLRLFASTEKQFSFSESDRWTLFHSISFDFSVWEIFGPLLYGGTLVIVPPEVARDTVRFAKLLMEHRITVLNQTPSAFYNLLSAAGWRDIDCFSELRFVVLGGERVQCAKLLRWFERKAARRPTLVNMYGITETTVHVTYREILAEDTVSNADISPIGLPIHDLEVYLLKDDLEPVPDGEVGEICVAGPGVAKGYLNRPELTAKRFVPNPYGDRRCPVLYRSGDLGRRLDSGELCYVGRADRQVKIRGYRIELGEIESALSSEPGVAASYVTTVDLGTSDARLVAYVIPDARVWPGAFLEAQLRQRRPVRLLSLKNGLEVAYLNRPETLFMYHEIFEDHLYEKLGVILNDGACVVDVGANIGMFCLFAMTKCKNPRLLAIEPVPVCAAVLRDNLTRYGANANVHAVGLSDQAGTAQFRHFHSATVMSGRYAGTDEATAMAAYLDNRYGQASVADTPDRAAFRQLIDAKLEYTEISCPLDTLSNLIDREQLDHIDLLKIDVQKSELDVLNGIREEHWPLIDQIVVEVHDFDGRLNKIQNVLKGRGYACCVDQRALLRGTTLSNVYARREVLAERRAAADSGQAGSSIALSSTTLVRQLRTSLLAKLPSYMMPAQLHLLPELPLTINGKVDERRLANMTPSLDRVAKQPADFIEQKVKEIWLDVLKLQDIDVDLGLADAGASSLTTVMIAMRLYKAFNIEIPFKELQDDVSIASIASRIRKADHSQRPSASNHHFG